MSHRIFGPFEVRREQTLQKKLSAVSALLVAVPLLWWIQSGKNTWRLKMWGTARIFLFHSENSYVSKECSFTKYNTLLHVYTYIFLRNAYGPLM